MKEKKTTTKAKTTKIDKPNQYTQEKAKIVLEMLAKGKLVKSIEERLGLSRSALYMWQERHEDFREEYARAREKGFDRIAEEMLEIASNEQITTTTITSEQGVTLKEEDNIQSRKLQVDTRKWLLSKWSKRKYGDQKSVEMTGKDGNAIEIKAQVETLNAKQQAVLDKVLDYEY